MIQSNLLVVVLRTNNGAKPCVFTTSDDLVIIIHPSWLQLGNGFSNRLSSTRLHAYYYLMFVLKH